MRLCICRYDVVCCGVILGVAMDSLVFLKTLFVFGFMVVFVIGETFLPMASRPFGKRDNLHRWGKNIGLFAINSLLSPLVIIPFTAFVALHAPMWREVLWGDLHAHWGFIIADVIVLDVFIYWWHRLNHRVPFLWQFHQVHHLDKFLDVSSAVRFHYGEVILSALARGGFVWLADVDFKSVLIAETLLLLASIFQHSNIRLPQALEKSLSLVIVTPGWHWLHHHHLRADTDSNYGNMLTLWDRLFHSRSANTRTKDMPIGLQGLADKPFVKLLILPFIKPTKS